MWMQASRHPYSCKGSVAKSNDTPIDPYLATRYRSLVGALQYCCITWPEVAFSVSHLCQFLTAPIDIHMQSLKRVLQYMQDTSTYGLHMLKSTSLNLVGVFDIDWVACIDDKRSVWAFCVFLGDNLISLSSSKQRVVSRSPTKSEYRTFGSLASEIKWIVLLLSEIGIKLRKSPLMFYDNVNGKRLAQNLVLH